jgi:hypothetical protein
MICLASRAIGDRVSGTPGAEEKQEVDLALEDYAPANLPDLVRTRKL